MAHEPRADARPARDRPAAARGAPAGQWRTAITQIEPNKILIRGYPVDEIMGRLTFGEAIYLLLVGELPPPTVGRLLGAVLNSSLDHGVTPPSTLSARYIATTRAPLTASVAGGVLSFGQHHGGDVESCMRFFDSGLALMRGGLALDQAATEIVMRRMARSEPPPGYGHRFHTRDPRAARLFQMALELELEGDHIRMARAVERALDARPDNQQHPLPINVDGAIAAICGDLGFAYELGNAIFIIARVPGLIAHAHEEACRQAPMRQIDPKDHRYDGPRERRLPETRR
jgi:citrate synthase